MLPIIAGIVTSLIQANLGKVAQAVVDKGLDKVEEKLGIKLEPNMSADKIAEIQLKAQEHEEFKIEAVQEAVIAEGAELTKRHQADMSSDSWLSKNVRPGTLIYLLTAYLLLAILDASGFKVAPNYVELLGQWGMLVMSFYFGGRSVEKVMQMIKSGKDQK